MGHALVDRYGTPEEVIAVLNRRRHLKAVGVLVGIVAAVGILIAAAAAMYSEEPTGAKPIPEAPR
ncbi:MAG TPA: hypothetical protein VFZ53_32905 [Polyangiaceae bacterium]